MSYELSLIYVLSFRNLLLRSTRNYETSQNEPKPTQTSQNQVLIIWSIVTVGFIISNKSEKYFLSIYRMFFYHYIVRQKSDQKKNFGLNFSLGTEHMTTFTPGAKMKRISRISISR